MIPDITIYIVSFLGGFILGMMFKNHPPQMKIRFPQWLEEALYDEFKKK